MIHVELNTRAGSNQTIYPKDTRLASMSKPAADHKAAAPSFLNADDPYLTNAQPY
jgi:hypothetical protein